MELDSVTTVGRIVGWGPVVDEAAKEEDSARRKWDGNRAAGLYALVGNLAVAVMEMRYGPFQMSARNDLHAAILYGRTVERDPATDDAAER
jgi:hypothetical protein